MRAFELKSLDEFFRVMCWSHVERNCEENLRSYNSEIREEILKDIRGIQAVSYTHSPSPRD